MSGQNREPEDDDRDLEIFDWDEYGRRSSWQFVSNALLLTAVILFAPGVLLGFTKAWHVAAAWTAIPLLALSIFIHWRSRLTLDAVTRPGKFSARVDDLIATLESQGSPRRSQADSNGPIEERQASSDRSLGAATIGLTHGASSGRRRTDVG